MTELNDLPDEMLSNILLYLPVKDLSISIPLTCKRLKYITKDELLWKLICKYDCDILEKTLVTDSWKDTLFKNYCKHFLSIDYDRLRKKYTNEFKKGIDISKCHNDECNITDDDLWVCLDCDYVGCSRYKNEHALLHAQTEGHAFNVN